MGRRKIEIQPITHERNRSVTFLKRKNGLFKKAYELGVLCSVDVAVIIFEEKPGHSPKLYQYGSDDIKAIVQRHIRFDGEKDTKSPSDFTHAKHDDIEDDDDHIEEEEEPKPKKRTELKAKPKIEKPAPSTSRMTDTEDEHQQPSSSRTRKSPPPPISNERHTKHAPEHDDYPPHKRARTSSYSDELRAAEARSFLSHPIHSLAAQQSYNIPGPYNALYGPQSPQLFDFLRNPNNLRALSNAYTQPIPYARPSGVGGVSDGFLQSLSELASQQNPGCGVGGIGIGAGPPGFEWPGYASAPPHRPEQGPETTWLDFLTGAPQNPPHLPSPHGQGQNHYNWPSPGSRRSDSSMSDFDRPLPVPVPLMGEGSSVLPPRVGMPLRLQSRDMGDIF